MNTLIHADIFFFISSIGFIILTALLSIILIQTVYVMRRVDRISKKIEDKIDNVNDEVRDLIDDLKNSMVFRFLVGGSRRKKKAQQIEK